MNTPVRIGNDDDASVGRITSMRTIGVDFATGMEDSPYDGIVGLMVNPTGNAELLYEKLYESQIISS